MELMNALLTAVIQVLAFTLVPFLWWFVTARKREAFLNWIGLRMPLTQQPGRLALAMGAVVLLFVILSAVMIPGLVPDESLAASSFAGIGSRALLPAILFAFVQTALSEEILFRGFLGKRFSNRFGFAAGNTLQALLFGLLHGVMFFSVTTPLNATVIVAFTGLIGWAMGYLNEKLAGGSILPGWLLHGLSNLLPALAALYGLI